MLRPCRVGLVLALALLLSACQTASDLYETVNPFADDLEPRLPGERITVMPVDRTVRADPALADTKVVLPRPYHNMSWPQEGGNAAHTMYHLALGDLPTEAWTADIGEGSASDQYLLAEPIVVDGVVYTMDALSTISAFKASDGSLIWQVDVEDEDEDEGYFGGGVSYDQGRLFVATGFAEVFALDAEDGSKIWTQKVSGPSRAAPTVSDGRVYVITIDNQVHALAEDDGRELWTHSGITETAGLLGSASPAVAGRTVIIPYSSGELYAVLAETGRTLWDDSLASPVGVDPLGALSHIRGLPIIDREMVMAISHSGTMIASDLLRGRRIWEQELGGIQRPWAAGAYVYVLTNNGEVVCLERATGRVRWIRALPRYEDEEDEEGKVVWSGPVLAGDRLIVAGSQGEAWTMSPYTGDGLGRLEMPEGIPIEPVVADETVYFLTNDAELIAYR
jgi:outer membrane protein assembly factor BamB